MAVALFSRAGQQPTLALANQAVASHLRQSGCMRAPHVFAAKGEFYLHSRVARLNTNATL